MCLCPNLSDYFLSFAFEFSTLLVAVYRFIQKWGIFMNISMVSMALHASRGAGQPVSSRCLTPDNVIRRNKILLTPSMLSIVGSFWGISITN